MAHNASENSPENKGSKPADVIERGQQAAANRPEPPQPLAALPTTPPPAAED